MHSQRLSKVAIIGSGISGLACAYYLDKHCQVTLFECNDYLGGHTATKTVNTDSGRYQIDTGFIVYNDRTYPRFMDLLDELGIQGKKTEMSFSVRNDCNKLEYNGNNVFSLFAQKRNLFNPRFYHFLAEIIRFNRLAKNQLLGADSHSLSDQQTLGAFLCSNKFGRYFSNNYILPMGAAIWSTSTKDMLDFPLAFFLKFFLNHGLLDIYNRPQWYVVEGGSNRYIKVITSRLDARICLNTAVTQVKRTATGVSICSQDKQANIRNEHFDRVIFACHSNQALALLADASGSEKSILSALHYQKNDVVLHTDSSLLPKHKSAWAAWNFRIAKHQQEYALPKVTYNMNSLQGLKSPETFCVTLNDGNSIAPEKILGRYQYAHPQYSNKAMLAQQRRHQINGYNHSWFCGAYWYNGFHEDGLRSAQDVVTALKKHLPIKTVSKESSL